MSKVDELSVEGLKLIASLLKTNSLRETAEELHLTTSSTSRRLVKLREMFNDELFTRQGLQMLPTAVGLSIKDSVRQSLSLLEGMTQRSEEFDPKNLRRTFKIATHEQMYTIHFIPLCQKIFEVAPYVTVEFHQLRMDAYEKLKIGELDFILAPLKERSSEDICTLPAFDASWKILVRAKHPLLKKAVNHCISSEELSEYKKFQVIREDTFLTPDGIDSWAMKRNFLDQETVMWVPFAFPVLEMLLKGDFTFFVYSRFADKICETNKKYQSISLGSEVDSIPYALKWHRNFTSDIAGQWFRSLAATSFRESSSTPDRSAYHVTS